MKLTFKMKVRLSLLVAFVFIIALIIHEDHAGVVLKKFKPKRALSVDKKPKVDSGISTKTPSKHQVKDKDQKKASTDIKGEVSIIRNSTGFNNETVVKLETISRDVLLNSSVVYEETKNTVTNSKPSKLSRSLSTENTDRNNLNCSKHGLSISENDQNCSTTHSAAISNISAEIGETKENSSPGLVQEMNNVVQDLSSDKIPEIPVSNEKLSSDSIVSQKEKEQLQTISYNHTADLPRNEIQIDKVLKQQSTNNTQSISNVSQPSVSDHLNISNANLKDFEIIANDSSAMNLNVVNESEKIRERDDSSGSENILTKEINQMDHESVVSPGLDFSALSEVTKNDSSLIQTVNESQILQAKDDSSSSEDVSTNESFLNQTGLESIVSAGLDFLAQSEVAKNAAVAMEIFNLSDSSLTDHIIDDSVIDLVLPSQPIQNNLVTEKAPSVIVDTKNDLNNLVTEKAPSVIVDTKNDLNNLVTEKAPSVIDTKNDLNPDNKVNESNIDNDKTEIDLDVLPVDKKKCPPPGICVFWFMARNTCNDDSQCLDSKICCRIRCSKNCIDV